MSNCGCHSKFEKQIAEDEVKVTFPTGLFFFAETIFKEKGKVILKMYGSDKSIFWKELSKLSSQQGSWKNIMINAEGRHNNHQLLLLLQDYIPGSGEYPFQIANS